MATRNRVSRPRRNRPDTKVSLSFVEFAMYECPQDLDSVDPLRYGVAAFETRWQFLKTGPDERACIRGRLPVLAKVQLGRQLDQKHRARRGSRASIPLSCQYHSDQASVDQELGR